MSTLANAKECIAQGWLLAGEMGKDLGSGFRHKGVWD